MNAINFVVRRGAGMIERGEIKADGSVTSIAAGSGQEISLNLKQGDVQGYQRLGNNLEMTLADGRIVMLEDFYSADGSIGARLFISADGYLNEVELVEGQGGEVYAQYGLSEQWGKWSPSDDLIFLDGTDVAHVAAAADDDVTMLGTMLAGGLSPLALGGAVVGSTLLFGDDGRTSPVRIEPTVDQDQTIIIGGDDVTDDDKSILISGRADPGSDVEVSIGGETLTTTADDDGKWVVVFEDDHFPGEGDHEVSVHVTEGDGRETDLVGPDVAIDLTGPVIDFTDGTKSVGDLTNLVDHDDGVEIEGTGEAGATIEVTIDGTTHTTTVGDDGTWAVVFSNAEVVGGEYETTVTVVSTDSYGNSTTVTDTVVIDTVPHPITIDEDTIEGDGVVNAAEASDGIEITGTSTPGAVLDIEIEGVTRTVTADADGKWVAVFTTAELPGGEYDAVITATTTDAAGNSSTETGTIRIDLVGSVAFDSTVIEGDNVVNAAEMADGFTLTGTAEPGSTVVVSHGSVSHSATVDADGNWTVDFLASDLASGDYDAEFTVTATDSAGNVSTDTRSIRIDTEAGVTIDDGQVGGDDMVNAAEQSAGITLTGTAEPGSTVEVTLGSVTKMATVAADGTWTADFTSADVPTGEQDVTMTAVATDTAGNTTTATDTLRIDTVNDATLDTPIEGDGVVNAAEQADGVVLTGTTQPGSTVTVEMGGVTHTATVDASGNWTASFAASEVAAGEYDATVNVTSVDAAGNTATATGTVEIDTVNDATLDTPIEGDGVVNAAEQADGVTLTGTTQPGSTVTVEMGGVTHTATVDASGNWTASFAASEVAAGEYDAAVNVTSVDAAGNTATATGTVEIDTDNSVTFNDTGIEGDDIVNAVERADGVTLTGSTDPGSTVTVEMGGVSRMATVDAAGNWTVTYLAGDMATGEFDAAVNVTSVDAAGNTATTSGTVEFDTLVRDFALTGTPGGDDGIVNATEAAGGLSMTGQTEPGSSVIVQLGMVSHVATVAADGSWSVNFAGTEIPQGEYTTTLTATATDRAGNVETLTDTVQIDTVAGSLTLSRDPIEGDNIINAVEASDGVVVTGTSDPGNVVEVTLGGVTHSVVTDAAGNWSAQYAASEITPGTYTADITATTIDAAGNSRTVTGSVDVDTEVLNLGFDTAPVEGDDVINAAERADGVDITGTVEAGSSVQVTMGGVTRTAVVDAAGNWTAGFLPADVPTGEYDTTVTVDVVDRAGNTDSISQTVRVDTLVNTLANSATPLEGDNIVNAGEAADGIELTGVVEAGSSVEVELGGTMYAAAVDAAGNWSVSVPESGLTDGPATAVVYATDAAGNTDSITRSFDVDMTAPDGPSVASYTRDHTGIRGISIDSTDDAVEIHHVHDDGSITDVAATGVDIPVLGETTYAFAPTIPDGSHLVVTSTDAAGNSSGTYLVLDESSTSVVDMANPNLGSLQIEAIDLQFAEDSQLTITEAQLLSLSTNSDSVVVHGGIDDTVTITGAVRTGATVDVDGQTHDVYTLGTEGTLIIDDDINVVI